MSSEKKTLEVFFFNAWLTHMRRHISAAMLRITWTERWLEMDRQNWPNAWPPMSPDLKPLDFFL
jgi:hypothetical protein